MIIKLLEQPIIAIHEAEIAGTVDGVIIKGNRVDCIYHRNMENRFAIPVENAIIGSDAVMIQDMTAMTMASQNVKSLKSMHNVFNISGKHLGCLQGIEVDEELNLQHMYTEYYKIEMSKTVNYESVIVVDVEEAELEKAHEEEICSQAVPGKEEVEASEADCEQASGQNDAEDDEAEVSMDIGPKIKWNEESLHKEEKGLESSELSVVKPMHQKEEKNIIPGVDPKYAYLCSKQLLEAIDIDGTFYEKGTIISPELIIHAIGNNAIVKVIVNAED